MDQTRPRGGAGRATILPTPPSSTVFVAAAGPAPFDRPHGTM